MTSARSTRPPKTVRLGGITKGMVAPARPVKVLALVHSDYSEKGRILSRWTLLLDTSLLNWKT